MAGLPWIKVWTAVRDHPKVQRLERSMGIRDGLGVVVRLWCWTADYHPGGDIPEADGPTAARSARGDACRASNSDVLSALVSAGMLDPIPGGYRVHDWQDMQTVHVEAEEKRRALAAERQSRYRERHGNASRNALRNGDVTHESVTETEKERETSSSSAAPAEPTPPPTLGEHLSERYPRLGALVEALDAAGLGRSLPRNATTRGALDQLALRHGLEALVADVARAPEGQSLAWYATRWAAWDFRPPSLPPKPVETTWPLEMQAALSPALYPDGRARTLAVRVERVNGTLLLTGDGEWTGWAAQAAFRAFPSAEVVVNGERVYPPNQEPLEIST